MLSPQANLRLLQRTSWSGFVYIAFLMVGIWPLAGFFPSQPPSWNAAQITRVYHDNTMGIRIGMVLVLVGSMFYVPWTAMLAKLIAAVEGKPGILTYCQIIAGCTNVLLTAYPAGWWLTASFRSDRDPQIVQLLNDIAWLQFLGVIAPFYFVVISIIYASLADKTPTPIIPRWVGVVQRVLHARPDTAEHHLLLQDRAVRLNGLFGFYLPFAAFWIWFFVMTYTIRRSLHRLDDVPAVSAASVRAV
jgi:hypothetical protein